MENTASLAYVFDGSFDGLLTAVFTAYQTKEFPETVAPEGLLQTAFGQRVVEIETDEGLARRVEQGIFRKCGSPAWQKVWTAFLSCAPEKPDIIYRYIRVAMDHGRAIHNHLSHPAVLAIDKINLTTGREAHHIKMFVRFARMENEVYFSRVAPHNNVIPMIMPHFVDRYSIQPFLIYDPVHQVAGVYDLRDWYMVETDGLNLPDLADDEREWQRLWRSFYKTIGIQERANAKCRRTHMPKRFWANMVEMQGEK